MLNLIGLALNGGLGFVLKGTKLHSNIYHILLGSGPKGVYVKEKSQRRKGNYTNYTALTP